MTSKLTIIILIIPFFFACCRHKTLPNQEMIDLLHDGEAYDFNPENVFSPGAKIKYCDSVLDNSPDKALLMKALWDKANSFLQLGEEKNVKDKLGCEVDQ